jgi:SAM-dependent methyltransferase
MNNSVDSSLYNRDYFLDHLSFRPESAGYFKTQIWEIMLTLVDLKSTDKIIDFGCGSGLLSFYINKKYGAEVIGVDYSAEAINICKGLADKYVSESNSVSFFHLTISQFPDISSINIIILADVIEHLYPEEVDALMNRILISRRKIGMQQPLMLLLHTDNILFLRYVRPILDLLSILSFRVTIKDILERNAFEDARHVNLYSARSLSLHLSRFGFYPLKLIYPPFEKDRVFGQFPFLARWPFLFSVIKIFYPFVRKFSPSFYGLYEFR